LIIQYNTVYSNGNIDYNTHDHGIYLTMNNGGTAYVRYNYAYNNIYGGGYSSGQITSGTNAIIWSYNLSMNNQIGHFVHGYDGGVGGSIGDKVYNFIDYGSGDGLRVGYPSDNGTANLAEVRNSLFINNTSNGVVIAGTGSELGTFTNNDVYGAPALYTGVDSQTGSNGNISSDPLFVSTVTPDFHLQPSSPAINAGVDVGLTSDFRGKPVPIGSAPDIGAYEFSPGDPGFGGAYRGRMGIHWMW
jgi:hypothetical protein